jgi:hypothetical protein
MASFLIQQQIDREACIAASACSLLSWKRIDAPGQAVLDPLVKAGMSSEKNGFEALRAAFVALSVPATVVRHTPTAEELVPWIESNPEAATGFLISHRVFAPGDQYPRAHVTVVFRQDCRWYRADPGTCRVSPMALADLRPDYAGDVATLVPA